MVGHSTKTAFSVPISLGIYLICLYSPKLIAEFEFCAKKGITGSFVVENSQKKILKIPKKKFLKKEKNSKKFKHKEESWTCWCWQAINLFFFANNDFSFLLGLFMTACCKWPPSL